MGLGVGGEQPFAVFSPNTPRTAARLLWAELGPRFPGNQVLVFPEHIQQKNTPEGYLLPLEPRHPGESLSTIASL